MAEESASKDDKTEEPTSRKLDNARKEGDIPLAQQGGQVLALATGVMALATVAGPMSDSIVRAVSYSGLAISTGDTQGLLGYLWQPLGYSFIVSVAAAVATTLVSLAQTKGGIWPAKLVPDPKKLIPSPKKLLRSFQREGLEDLGLAMLRVAIMAFIIVIVLGEEYMALPMLVVMPPADILTRIVALIVKTIALCLALFALFAVVDYVLTGRRFTEKMKMTKQQVKREHKEDEGDPQIKGRRRKKHMELTQGRVAAEVPRADAVIVNPTHIAIAIRYKRGEDRAPRVTAKGKGAAAEVIRELAKQHGVPIMQDIPLARLLHKRVKVGGEVPAETYKAVAAVLAFAYRVKGRGAGRS